MVVIAAVDRDEGNSTIVEQGQQLAKAFDVPLHVVHVLSQSELRNLERASFEDTGQAVEMERVKELAQTIAEEKAEEIAPEAEPIGLVGDAAQEIVEYADDKDAKYIVVGGRSTSPVGKVIFGSVSQSVILTAERPVVAITD